jgi:hypothetical protein
LTEIARHEFGVLKPPPPRAQPCPLYRRERNRGRAALQRRVKRISHEPAASAAHRGLAPLRQGSLWHTALDAGHIWQARFYDFVVFTEAKRVEKLRYMHRNPVKRGLVLEPQQWHWSSYRHYAQAERGIVLINEERKAELRVRKIA